MIESCSRKRMLLGILALGALSILVIILESRHLHTPDETSEASDIHETHHLLKEKLSPDDMCWKTEPFEVVKNCDLCSEDEKAKQDPVVCAAAKGYKEVVMCKTSGQKTYRSCDRVVWVEESKFWKFELFFALSSFFCGIAVFVRQKQLDHWMYQRIQRQMASGV